MRKPPNSKAIQKVILLRSGVKLGLMKKLFLYTLISLAVSLSANSDELSSINKLIENGYKIISEDIITRQDSKSFIKTFTLQNKKSSLIICNVSFDSGGYLNDFSCLKP